MSDRFRRQHRRLDEAEQADVDAIKDGARRLEMDLEALPNGREKALALTKLEEAVMWGVKAASAGGP